MFGFFAAFFNACVNEVDRLRRILITIIAATIIGVLPILWFRMSIGAAVWWVLIPSLFTIYRLCSIRHLLVFHLAGEAIEFAEGVGNSIGDAILRAQGQTVPARTTSTGLLDNALVRHYLAAIRGIFVAQTILFLAAPLYVNYTAGGVTTAIVIAMLLAVIAASSAAIFVGLFKFAVVGTAMIYVVALTCVLFPQVPYYMRSVTGGSAGSSIQAYLLANKIENLRAEQREAVKVRELQQALKYQESHPCQELPKQYAQTVAEVGRVLPATKEETASEKAPSAPSLANNSELEKMSQKIYGN